MKHPAAIRNIEEILTDALEFFKCFSQPYRPKYHLERTIFRGWLIRLLHHPQDKRMFQTLDQRLVVACLKEKHMQISEESAENLRQPPVRIQYCRFERVLLG